MRKIEREVERRMKMNDCASVEFVCNFSHS